MIETGMIEMTDHYDIRGNIERIDYRWTGGSSAYVSWELLELGYKERYVGDEVELGPFKLKIIDEDIIRRAFLVTRMDNPFWRLIYLWHCYNKSFDLAYHRFITTLAVWRLAEYNPAVIPSWRDIYFIQKIRNKLHD